jgi:hypothetical protein
MRAFPDNLPFLYKDEKKDDYTVHERIETCKIWAALAELENYEVVETGVERQIQFKLPAELEEEQKEKLEPIERLNKLLGLQVWSMNLIDDGAIGQTFTIQSAMEYAQELVRQDDLSYQPTDFLSEQRPNAIAAFAAALVIHQWQWVEDNDYASWCREQLLIATKQPEPPARFHDKASKDSMDYRRSAARALPILLLKYPKDRKIRKAVFALTLHRNDEVRAYLFNGLKTLWATDQKTIWKCIDTVIKSSRITEVPSSNKLVDFLEELLLFTINAYIHFEKEDKRYNEWCPIGWNLLFFQIIANALLRLPKNVAEPMLFDPIVTNWERSPAIMKELLGGFVWIKPQSELEDRFIEIWLDVGDRVLVSAHNNILRYNPNNEMRDILGLLIFVEPSGIVYNVREGAPMKKMTPFISRWCDTVGHRPDCFSSLVRLLKEGGFDLVPEFGISWLYNCIRKADDHKNFFERSKTRTFCIHSR